MAEPIDWMQRFADFLELRGHRLTREGRLVAEVALAHPQPIHTEELVQEVARRRHPRKVRRSTVYRTLTLLTEAGLVARTRAARAE